MRYANRLGTLTTLAAVLALSGCGNSTPPPSPDEGATSAASRSPPAVSTAPPATAPTTAATTPAPADSVVADHVDKKHYRIDIDYPGLPASAKVLADALHATADKAKREFMRGIPDPKQFPGLAHRQLQLKIDFSVAARMPRFISVRERGMADTGGAHPLPIEASFVYDTASDQVITLDDLFTDPDQARARFAKLARTQLEKKLLAKVPGGARTPEDARQEWTQNMRDMINAGTEPKSENFSEFAILAGAGDKASGLQLIFSPYQVAPYVYGTQSVDVPVDAFADLLKPAFRDGFDGGDAGTHAAD